MPFANYKFPEGILDHARKEEIIHRTTEMFVEYFGEGYFFYHGPGRRSGRRWLGAR